MEEHVIVDSSFSTHEIIQAAGSRESEIVSERRHQYGCDPSGFAGAENELYKRRLAFIESGGRRKPVSCSGGEFVPKRSLSLDDEIDLRPVPGSPFSWSGEPLRAGSNKQ
jgi:hypothetical protein